MLEFRSNNAIHRPVLDALDLIRRHADARLTYYPAGESVPSHKGVLGDWTTLVYKDIGKGGRRVVRSVYEICTFQALRERLRCKEIWVVGADKWRNPDEDLPHDFEAHRDAHYAALRKPLDPTAFIGQLRAEMRDALAALDTGLPKLTWLEIITSSRRAQYSTLTAAVTTRPPNSATCSASARSGNPLGVPESATTTRWPNHSSRHSRTSGSIGRSTRRERMP